MKRNIIFIIVFAFISINSYAQEQLNGLYINAQTLELAKNNNSNLKSTNTAVMLPFIDDFTDQYTYPNQQLWDGYSAFVNTSYAVNPPTYGVATLDALNDSGMHYTNASQFAFLADELTSNNIRLDSIFSGFPRKTRVSDSLYISFYYQPQGIGNSPESMDSLKLEFYSVTDSTWSTVWSTVGMSLADFQLLYNTDFRQIILPILDSTKYFNDEFRFRFANYASLANNNIPSWAGNVDQWNIDYVYLNSGRTLVDTIRDDISFAYQPKSLLNEYTQVPARQFTSSMVKSNIEMFLRNNDDNIINSRFFYNIYDELGTSVDFYNGGAYNVDPYLTNGYQTFAAHANPPINYTFPNVSNNDITYKIEYVFEETGGDNLLKNDTIHYYQHFFNCFAYDDGTPEAGYGLSVEDGKTAVKFTMTSADTLRGVRIYFNPVYDDENYQYFKICVWSSLDPEVIIYESDLTLPEFSIGSNTFTDYIIDDEIVVNGDFYIGIQQETSDNMNIGFDFNATSSNKNFYNIGGGWIQSMYQGALMIRPVLGYDYPTASLEDNTMENIKTWPNPVTNNIINIDIPNNIIDYTVNIYDISGQLLITENSNKTVSTRNLNNGIYIIKITDNDSKKAFTSKVIIAN